MSNVNPADVVRGLHMGVGLSLDDAEVESPRAKAQHRRHQSSGTVLNFMSSLWAPTAKEQEESTKDESEGDECSTQAGCHEVTVEVVFEHEGPLGLHITDTESGKVVVTGPKEHNHEVDPSGKAAELGLKKMDTVVQINHERTIGKTADEVKAMIVEVGRPLRMVLLRLEAREGSGSNSGSRNRSQTC